MYKRQDVASAALLSEQMDFVSFHYYKDIDDFEKGYADLKKQINKPLVLQEFGLPSNRGLWNPLGASEKGQAVYYEQFQEVLKSNQIHYLSWTLYDFENIPNSVAGSLPWRKQKQKHFGFIDKNGYQKPAFEFIAK